ncbi:MAG: hypothetical protein ACI83D_000523 [Planctomycetota bacterium]|jgi:hypothetical protein
MRQSLQIYSAVAMKYEMLHISFDSDLLKKIAHV